MDPTNKNLCDFSLGLFPTFSFSSPNPSQVSSALKLTVSDSYFSFRPLEPAFPRMKSLKSSRTPGWQMEKNISWASFSQKRKCTCSFNQIATRLITSLALSYPLSFLVWPDAISLDKFLHDMGTWSPAELMPWAEWSPSHTHGLETPQLLRNDTDWSTPYYKGHELGVIGSPGLYLSTSSPWPGQLHLLPETVLSRLNNHHYNMQRKKSST